MYRVLFVVLLFLQQGCSVSFGNLWVMGVKIFVGGPGWGLQVCVCVGGGVMALCGGGGDPRVGR